jgi:hypothetical protein
MLKPLRFLPFFCYPDTDVILILFLSVSVLLKRLSLRIKLIRIYLFVSFGTSRVALVTSDCQDHSR